MKKQLITCLMVVLSWMTLIPAQTVNACGVIDIDRRILPPNTQVTNISVKNTTLDIKIEEQVAIVTVDEIFHNSNNHQLEGTFILPILPETTVQNLALWINGKETKGELLDKDKALQYYQDIVRRMIDPALLEYAGHGMLKLRVFPIPPAQQDLGQGPGNVRIKYSYTYRLPNDNGVCTFRHPWGTNKFSSEIIDSAVIKTSIKSAIPIKTVYSPTYPNIDINRKDDNTISLSFEQTKMKPDKDFILYYTLSDKQFGVNLVSYKKPDNDGFFMMLLAPKYALTESEIAKKDVLFVLDTSGSMADSNKIEQAKNAINFCINSLKESDRFNLITFSTEVRPFKPSIQEVTKTIKDEALNWVKSIDARGGTNIDEALQSALSMVDPKDSRPFIVVFMTDGLPTVGEQNIETILKNVASKNKSNVRIFTFGVGYDVNTHLLDKLAEINRGTREYITPEENIEVKVSSFYDKIAYPVLADVKLDVSGIEIYDRYPKVLSDLFRGTQLVIFGRYKSSGNKLITLSGVVNGEPRKFEYESTFTNQNISTDFIPRLWATTKIGYLLDEVRLRGESKEVKEDIIKIAMEYGILTPYTSYLVMEDTKTAGAPMTPLRNSPRIFTETERNEGIRAQKEMRNASGPQSVTQSMATERLKKGDSDAAKPEGNGYLDKMVRDTVKQVADKTFYLNNNIWYDSKYDEKDTKTERLKVKYLSDEYFTLISKQPQLAKYLAIGEKVVVCFDNKIYEIIKE
ncbi:MAG: VIT and VWA domain-containing protein [Candidatus Brocadiia bacterium]